MSVSQRASNVSESSNDNPFDDEHEAEGVHLGSPHGQHHDDEMDMTALIDITFLLLIFFVVTSKLANEVKQPLPVARNGQLVATDKSIILTMKRGGGNSAVVGREDGSVFSDDPEQQAAEIEEYLQIGFNSQKTNVLVRADGAVRNGDVNHIKELISESIEEGQLISFGVMQEN